MKKLIITIITILFIVNYAKADIVTLNLDNGIEINLHLEQEETIDDYIIYYDDSDNNQHIYFTNKFFELLANSDSKSIRDMFMLFKTKYQHSIQN